MRLFIKLLVITSIIVFMFQVGVAAGVQQTLRGEIVAVNSQQGTFLFKSSGELKQYRTNLHTKLFLNGSQVNLNALRPVTEEDFQEAVIKLNNQGNLIEVRAEYDALPIEVRSISKDEANLKVNILNSNKVLDITYQEKMVLIRNGSRVEIDELQSGDQGLVILGLEDKVRKIKVKNYQYKGEAE